MPKSRRDFLKATAVSLSAGTALSAEGGLPRRKLGKTGLDVSIVGLGGARVGQLDSGEQAAAVIKRCYDLGVNYFDTAAAGAYGLSQTRYGRALKGLRDKIIFGTKTRHRTYEHSALDLQQSLSNLKTDHIDLYQIHNVMSDEDIEAIFRPRGLMEMIEKAKRDGKIRFVGVTGHTEPGVLNNILSRYEFDTILMPLSVTDGANKPKSFERVTLPAARKQNLGIIAMKTLGAGAVLRQKAATLDESLRYALALPIATAIMGCDQVSHIEDDIRIAKTAKPLTAAEMESLRRRVGHLELAQLEPWKTPPDPVTGDRVYHAD
ncbi:MAG: aldo/keto reductase [bacterium]|nr:aldo/keto reductase [bacterium]